MRQRPGHDGTVACSLRIPQIRIRWGATAPSPPLLRGVERPLPDNELGDIMFMIVEGYDEPYLVEFNYDPEEGELVDTSRMLQQQEEIRSDYLDQLDFG